MQKEVNNGSEEEGKRVKYRILVSIRPSKGLNG